MLTAHKIALKANNKQATYFAQAAGVARFSYNWALSEWKQQYEAHKLDPSQPKPSQLALRRQLNAIKREQFPWMLKVTKNAPQMSIIQLGMAFKRFFSGHAKYPQYRKKGSHDRFTLTNDQFTLEGSRIRIPHLGWVRLREPLRFSGKILSATFSRSAQRWFVSIAVDTGNESRLSPAKNQGVVGVDLGISVLATLSTGEKIIGSKISEASIKRLKRLSRQFSRKKKGSKNREKAKMKLARVHAKHRHVRQEGLHQLTTMLTKKFDTLVIEDLHVKGMMKNHHLARAVANQSFFEFRRQLDYKSVWRGGSVIVADRWFASSKICSHCDHKREDLTLSMREWRCFHCHTLHDRDINAAINLKKLAVSSTVSVCGEEGSGFDLTVKTKPASMKQKFNAIDTYR